jgi:hypothetical protein
MCQGILSVAKDQPRRRDDWANEQRTGQMPRGALIDASLRSAWTEIE